MKITWFGGSTFRIQIGGQVVVVDPHLAPAAIDQTELVSGADQVVAIALVRAAVDPVQWRPRVAQRVLDVGDNVRPVQAVGIGPDSLLIDGDDDMPLLLAGGGLGLLGRWAEKAVVVLFGQDLEGRAGELLDASHPRLIALAGEEAEIGRAFDALRDRLDGTGLVALEAGLAVEA